MKMLLIALAIVAAGLAYFSAHRPHGLSPAAGGLPPREVISTGEAAIGGAFTLSDTKGNTVNQDTLKSGPYHLLFFGFTNCPDVCPTMLQMVADTFQKLPPATAAKIQPVFITVDPDRDDAATLQSYIDQFDTRITAWRGSDEQLKAMAKNYLVYYAKRPHEDTPSATTPTSDSTYTMDHSAFLYLFGPDGKYVTHFPNTTSQQILLDKLTELTK